MKKNNIIQFILPLLLLSGCTSTKIKDFSKYQTSPILENTLLNKEDSIKKELQIVVLELSDNDIAQAKSANIGVALAVNIENVITQDKLAKILDRSAFKKLQDEIALVELNDSSEAFSGPITADYAISGNISTASLESKYVAGSNYYDFANKRFVNIPPKFKYEATISGNIKIYKLPSLKTVASFAFNGKSFRTENAPKTGHIFARKVDMSALKTEDIGLLSEAAKDAVDDIKADIKNFISELNKTYIFARKTYKNRSIFQISMGSKNGLEAGDKFTIYTLQETHNPINDSTIVEEVKLGEAIASNQISSDTAWIIVKDKKIVEKIRIGDFVRRTFKKSFADKIGDISDKANSVLY